MVYGLWLSASGLQANKYRQDVIANNLANVETVGFKRDLAVFCERPVASQEPSGDPTLSDRMLDGMSGGTFVAPTFTSFEQGPILRTERPLDVALQGDGFFAVRDGNQTRYTRDGRFAIDERGDLVMVAGGRPVLSETGQPIRITAEQRDSLHISGDGTIWAGEATVAKLGIVGFADKSELRKVGSDLFEAPDKAPTRPSSANVVEGAVEASTVDPTSAMVNMIEASRAYQLNATMISMQDTMLGRAANDIAKLV
jgi:flagellar basal-body rod protein FlgF